MKTKKINFNSEMVQAIIDNRKTQTRRVIDPQPKTVRPRRSKVDVPLVCVKLCPYGKIGDALLVYDKKEASSHNTGIVLEITNIKVEKVQEIHRETKDIEAEGILSQSHHHKAEALFISMWDSIYGQEGSKSWKANPWVWVISFRILMFK